VILGMSVATFTTLHVVLSLVGIVSGLAMFARALVGQLSHAWTAVFLSTTILTSVTGFPIPPFGLDPPRIFGIASLVLLAVAVAALYAFRLAGHWRWIYVVTALLALYLNCFVAVVQSFAKIPFLTPLAPTQTEPPFALAQGVLLIAFVVIGVLAVRNFRPVAHLS
jgi:hypothetical protein